MKELVVLNIWRHSWRWRPFVWSDTYCLKQVTPWRSVVEFLSPGPALEWKAGMH